MGAAAVLRPLLSLLAATALVAALAAPPAATAAPSGSIVFIRAGDVWLMRPDGSRQRQVTRGGGYSSPSQSNRGTIVALRRRALVRLTRRGRRLGRPVALLGTNVRRTGDVLVGAGPHDARVSPNGRLVAYWVGTVHQRCSPFTSRCAVDLRDNVAVTRVDRFTSHTRFGLVRDYREPSWIGNGRLLVFSRGFSETVAIDAVGRGDLNLAPWFHDPRRVQLAGGQVAQRAGVLALLAGTNRLGGARETIRIYTLRRGALPRWVCVISNTRRRPFARPSWRPDGRRLAWEQSDGIHVARVPALTGSSPPCTAIRERRVARGGQPFFGPAGVGPRDGLPSR